jgi:hypothetical protein
VTGQVAASPDITGEKRQLPALTAPRYDGPGREIAVRF